MPQHNLVCAQGKQAVRGNFGLEFVGDVLYVPEDLYLILASLGLQTLEEFVEYANCYYVSIGARLGWDIRHMINAYRALVMQFADIIPTDSFLPAKPQAQYRICVR